MRRDGHVMLRRRPVIGEGGNLPEIAQMAGPCITHGGTPGFTNVVPIKRDGSIVVDAHATEACVLVLDQDAATAVRDTLTEWLG